MVVMGHVDHGKTTLLDYIKKTKIAEREAGGITQSIGAYEIEHSGSKITFIDTPGHQAFLAMRARGARIADIALLVVAADDGVKEQTKESLKIIAEVKIPFVVVINKIDKPGADANRVINELAREGILLESYGGAVSWQAVSAKTGEGITELLELILLAAEMESLTYNPDNPPSGYVLESKLDSRRGPVATIVIKDGVLKVGDEIFAGQIPAKIKLMEDFLGQKITAAAPSSPALVLGFTQLPAAGLEFRSAKNSAPPPVTESHLSLVSDQKARTINLFLKAGDSGSLEALELILTNISLPESYRLLIIDRLVGDITDGDIKTAGATGAIIVGFKTKITKPAENLAKTQSVKVIRSEIIYKLTEELEQWLGRLGKEVKIGELEILAVFGKKAGRQIIGGRVVEGRIVNHSPFIIIRNNNELGRGKIINLQSDKKDVQEIGAGSEGGLLVETEAEIRAGDRIVIKLKV